MVLDNTSTLLEKVMNAMRIDEDEHAEELQDLISAAKREIIEAGVSPDKVLDSDELIRRACITYCKAHFGYDDEKGKFEEAFQKMLIKIALLNSYKGESNEN